MTTKTMNQELKELRERIANLEDKDNRIAVEQVRAEPVRTVVYRFAAPTKVTELFGNPTAKYVARERGRFTIIETPTTGSLQSTRTRRVFSNNEELTRDEAISFLKAGFSVHIERFEDGARMSVRTISDPKELDEPHEEKE